MIIKICGITRPADAQAAARAGADLLGFNLCPASPRYVQPDRLGELIAAVEPPAVAVAVTVDASAGELCELVHARGFRVVQLHGDEPAELADAAIQAGAKVIKAFRVSDADFVKPVEAWLASVRRRDGVLAVLLDTAAGKAGRFGGSGRRFNWQWLADARSAGRLEGVGPVLLAGGLTPANVGDAVRLTRPWGVDVAGGVESAPGVKSLDKVRDFIRNARRA